MLFYLKILNKIINMLTYNYLSSIFPRELVIYIGEYNPEHKKIMKLVFDELNDYHSTVYCDNDMCEQPFHIDKAYTTNILKQECHFCCEDCQSYGEWSIRYDYRKSMRRRQIS